MSKKSILNGLTSLLTALGINAVPVGGMLFSGWAPETAMLLYLIENIVAVPLAVLCVRLLAPAQEDVPGEKRRERRSMLQGHLLVGIVFSIGSGIFMGFFLFGILKAPIELSALRFGAATILAFQLFGFISDFFLLRPLSLVRAEKVLAVGLGRVALLFLAVFFGVFLALFSDWWFLIPFIVLKTIVDIGQPIQFLYERSRSIFISGRSSNLSGLG